MNTEIDPNTALTGVGGVTGVAALFYWLRSLRRGDKKAESVDETWNGIVAGLREEVKRLTDIVNDLVGKVEKCEIDKHEMSEKIAAFERRYGSRREDREETTP